MTVENNPLLTRSPLPYQLPQWDKIKPEHIVPAITAAVAATEQAWDAIASNTDAPTVANTVEALNAADRQLAEVSAVAYTLFSSIGGSAYEDVEAQTSEILTAHSNRFLSHKGLFARLSALPLADVDAETRYFVTEQLAAFRRGGIALPQEKQQELAALEQAISKAETAFSQRATQAMTDHELQVTDPQLLAGLTPDELAQFAQKDGSYSLPIDNFTHQALLAKLADASLRGKLYAASIARGLGQYPESDTRKLLLEIVRLRAQRAALLGYPHHAQAVADSGIAKDATAIMDLLTAVAGKALDAAKTAAEDLRKRAAAAGLAEFTAADWSYFEAQQRCELGLDEQQLAEYFELDSVVENGIFYAATKLFGITFVPRPDLAGYLPDVRSWEVLNEDGSTLAIFQADFFRRKGKSGGAWMHPLIEGAKLDGNIPVIMNNCNFTKPAPGKPCLLTWDHVNTLFHEFGHALHGMFTATKYRATAGTNTARDFVEAPSQFNEMWALHPQVVANYARHYRTGEVLPQETIDSLIAAANLGQAFATCEQLAAALVDQVWHHLPATADFPTDVEAFEKQALQDTGMDYELIAPRYRSAYFTHTFGGGYDAGYYAYVWAEVLAAEVENWYRTVGAKDGDGGLNRAAGQRVRDEILSRGSSRSEMDSVIALIGKQPTPEAVLARRGLI